MPPIFKRDNFENILADAEVPMTPQRCVQFADMATPTSILRPAEHLEVRTPHLGVSQVPPIDQGLFDNPQLGKDFYEEGFSWSLQVAATEFQKLREPKVAKLKGGYSSDPSFVFQAWLKDIWVYVLEHHLSLQEAIQLVKDYTSEHAWLELEYYLGLTSKSEQSFQRLIDHLSLTFQSCKTVSSLMGEFYNQSQKACQTEDMFMDKLQVLV